MSSIREILEGLRDDGYNQGHYDAKQREKDWLDNSKLALDQAEAQLNTYVEERVREALEYVKPEPLELVKSHPDRHQAKVAGFNDATREMEARIAELEEKKQ